jgi:hypothetical protein
LSVGSSVDGDSKPSPRLLLLRDPTRTEVNHGKRMLLNLALQRACVPVEAPNGIGDD